MVFLSLMCLFSLYETRYLRANTVTLDGDAVHHYCPHLLASPDFNPTPILQIVIWLKSP